MKDKYKGETSKIIRSKRIELGLSQKKLALAVGWKSSQSIANIESGTAPLPLKRVEKLAKVLGLSPKSLMGMALSDKVGEKKSA